MTQPKKQEDFSSRMSALETEVHGIKASLVTLSNDIRALADGARTNWGTLAAWSAVICMVVGGFSSTLYIINQMSVARVEDRALMAGAELDSKINALEENIKLRDELTLYRSKFGELEE